jgi:hypothetical protein
VAPAAAIPKRIDHEKQSKKIAKAIQKATNTQAQARPQT